MTPEERIAEFREDYEKKRQAVAVQKPEEKGPKCRCGLHMVKHWSGGHYWCPVCKILETELKNPITSPKTTVLSQTEIRTNISNHPLYGFALRLADKIMSEHNFDSHIVFRNTLASSHQMRQDGNHIIKFGYGNLDVFAKVGFREYKTWSWLWNGFGKLDGKKAVWAVVLHEVAHAIQNENGGRYRGSAHNTIWANAVEELQILYPFEEVKYL